MHSLKAYVNTARLSISGPRDQRPRRIERSELNMTRWRVISSPTYQGPFDLAPEHVLTAVRRYKTASKKPTSVALDKLTLKELTALAAHQDIPYLVLRRIFILRGIESMKQAA
jgi:hypothetical protein